MWINQSRWDMYISCLCLQRNNKKTTSFTLETNAYSPATRCTVQQQHDALMVCSARYLHIDDIIQEGETGSALGQRGVLKQKGFWVDWFVLRLGCREKHEAFVILPEAPALIQSWSALIQSARRPLALCEIRVVVVVVELVGGFEAGSSSLQTAPTKPHSGKSTRGRYADKDASRNTVDIYLQNS